VITALFSLIDVVLRLYVWALILAAVFSTLAAFSVLDTRNRLVWSIGDFLYRITDPVLRPIRNVLPTFGSIDLSPLIAILLIEFALRPLLRGLYSGIVFGSWQPLIF
jgi:YggT family protein